MDAEKVFEYLKEPCAGDDWRKLMDLMSDGSRGMIVILRVLYESKEEVVAGELARRLNVSTARVASALNVLEKKGYVTRCCSKTDGRKVVVRLTKEGEQAFLDRKALVLSRLQPMIDKLNDEECVTLLTLINKLIQ